MQPVIIVGDFNATPEEFMSTSMSSIMQVTALATRSETINTGSELDWALISNVLAANMSIEADWSVPYKPHRQLIVKIHRAPQQIAVRQIGKFNPAPRLDNVRFTWHMIEVQVCWLGDEGDQISQHMANLCSRMERFSLQQLESPKLGKGSCLDMQHGPIQDVTKPWVWQRGSQSFWGQVEVRLQQLLTRPSSADKLLRA